MTIERHKFNVSVVATQYEDVREGILFSLSLFDEGVYFVLRDLLSESIINYCYSIVLKADPQTIATNGHLVVETGIGLYKMASNIGKPVSITFRGQTIEFTPPELNYSATYQGFITVFMVAICTGNMAAIKTLSAINLDALKQNPKIISSKHRYHYARFLQKLFEKGAPHLQLLLEVSHLLDESDIPEPVYDFALRIDGPQIDLFTALLTREEDTFNENLAYAIELHKNYYAQSAEYAVLSEGLISVPLSALKILAVQQGMNVTVTSDYLIS